MNWLDTETKSILQKAHEPKSAPPKAAEFALVLLRKGTDRQRLVRAICRINECSEADVSALSRLPVPLPISFDLDETEAVYGQFELICCDAVGAFFRSEVLLEQTGAYLQSLYRQVLKSPEFKPTRIDVLDVPTTDSGEKFVDQFLGVRLSGQKRRVSRFSVWVPYKKVRIMMHWAARVGVQAEWNPIQNVKDEEDTP